MAASLTSSLPRNPATILRALNGIKSPNPGISVRRIQPLFHYPPSNSSRARTCITATNNEEASAKAAAVEADSGASTIFDKIISKEIPSTIVYEDEKVLAFRDINPQAPVHVVIIPKFRDGLIQLGKAEPRHGDILGHLLYASKIVAEKEGILDGFRVVINNGPTACKFHNL